VRLPVVRRKCNADFGRGFYDAKMSQRNKLLASV
jgi:hypothetical protein